MAERMPLAYPNLGTSQINFSLPLRLAHQRSTSTLSVHSSTRDPLEVPYPMRPRATSAPVGLARASGPARPSGSNSIPSSTSLDQDNPSNPSNLRPRAVSYPHIDRRAPPRLQLQGQTRFRTSSVSTTASSLEASLAELEELIEVLSTPVTLDDGFFGAQTKAETETEIEYSKAIRIMPTSAKQLALSSAQGGYEC